MTNSTGLQKLHSKCTAGPEEWRTVLLQGENEDWLQGWIGEEPALR